MKSQTQGLVKLKDCFQDRLERCRTASSGQSGNQDELKNRTLSILNFLFKFSIIMMFKKL